MNSFSDTEVFYIHLQLHPFMKLAQRETLSLTNMFIPFQGISSLVVFDLD